MMKILYFAPLNSFHTKRWISFFRDQGHDVHVFPTAENTIGLTGVTIHENPVLAGGSRRSRLQRHRLLRQTVRGIVRDIAPDVIHVHWIDFDALSLRGIGVPLVMTAWGSDILMLARRNILTRIAFRYILGSADALTCDAVHLKDSMERLGAGPGEVRIIFFGTNVRDFNPQKRDPLLADQLGFPRESRIVISLRGLEPVYDVATFIRAIPLIAGRHADARFVVVGDGSQRKELETLAEGLGIAGIVRFVGRLPDADLQRFTASASVYASTSLSDGGLAASTAESMACGVPSVITDFGNNRDWVEHGMSGYLFPLKDHVSLADRVSELLSNPEDARRIGSAGREVIEKRNNYFTEMAKVEELYRVLCTKQSVNGRA